VPTYPANEKSLHDARRVLRDEISLFVKKARFWERTGITAQTDDPPVVAHRVTTGVGKTKAVIEILSENIKKQSTQGGLSAVKPWIFFVPTHRLGEEIAEEFRRRGLDAQVFKGRTAYVGLEKSGPKMCDNIEQVDLAIRCHASVSSSCCKAKDRQCK